MQNENIVRTLRRKRGLKQAELAAELGISRSHLSKIENESDAAGRQLLEAMAVFFKVPVDTFFPLLAADREMLSRASRDAEQHPDEDEVLALWRSMGEEERQALLILMRRTAST
jgi:transcriptional regulator with XRE-family HTH domain